MESKNATSAFSKPAKYLILLQLAAAGVFFGRAWQHLFWDAPYRAILWDERLMRNLLEGGFGISWNRYLTDPATDAGIQLFIQGVGVLFLASGLAAFAIRTFPRISQFFLTLGGLMLVLLSVLYAKEKFWLAAQFFEHALQFSSPFMLVYYFRRKTLDDPLEMWMKIAIALTFFCHGLFAMNFYPRPAYFGEMTMNILGVSESEAILLLRTAGMLDTLVSIWIFLPGRWSFMPLAYAVFWGAATTLARVWAYYQHDFWMSTLHQWLHESVMRVPHFLIPLFLLLSLRAAYHRSDSRKPHRG